MRATIVPFRTSSRLQHRNLCSDPKVEFIIETPPDLARRVVDAAAMASKTPEALLLAFIEEGFPARVGAA